jgi:quercetin dioxygenase-like cupin family protein
MRIKRRSLIVALATVAAVTAVILGPLAAQGGHGGPIHVDVLTDIAPGNLGGEFTDDVSLQFRYRLDGERRTKVINSHDPSRTVVAEITVDPNGQFPWHTHPGPVVVNVAQGHLTYVQFDCVHHEYPAGTAFIDPGRGNVHTAFAGPDGAVLIATFFEIPDSGPLTITDGVTAPEGACGL